MRNNLFLIELLDDTPCAYDWHLGFVVASMDKSSARNFVEKNKNGGDEPRGIWLDDTRSKCTYIGVTTIENDTIVLASFNAG